MKHFSKKTWIVMAVIAIAAIAAIGAYAYWTNSGSGTGSAATGTNAAVVVNQTSVVSGLYPGGPSQPLSGNFNNPNSGATYVTAVTASVTGTSAPLCSAADFVIGGTSNTPGSIPSGNAQGAWSGLNVSMTNTAANQDACKNATLTITYASS